MDLQNCTLLEMLLLRWSTASLRLEGLRTDRDRYVSESHKSVKMNNTKNDQSTVFVSLLEVNPVKAQQPCYCEEV